MIKMIRGLIWLGLWGSIAALAGSFAGAWHPIGDSLAVFRVQAGLGVLGFSLLIALAGRRWGLVFVPIAAVAMMPMVLSGLIPSAVPVEGISLYQKNLFFRMADPTLVVSDIRIADPDVVTLQEVTEPNKQVLFAVQDRMPSQIHCSFSGVGGVAIASRWPMVTGRAHCPAIRGLAAMQVDAPGGPLWLVSLHLHWPYPYGQYPQLQEVLAFLEGLEGRILLGGDFNMVPWSHALRRIAEVTDSQRVGTPQSTFARFHPWLRLPIDHVFAPGRGAIQIRPLLGSDHYGVLARIDLHVD